MDEVPLTFDCPPNRTVTTTGEKCVSITTTGHEKTSFTCVLACSASGEKLKPMLIFKRKTLPKENFPADIVVRCNEKGWMCESLMIDWLNEVWRKRKGAFFHPSGILIMDSMAAHLTDPVKEAARKCSASLGIIPGGLTKKLQPLDLTTNHSFKTKMRVQWESWMANDLHSYTKSGRLKKASFAEVAKWVSNAWNAVETKTVISGFVEAGIVPPCQDLNPGEIAKGMPTENEENMELYEEPTENDENIELDEEILELFQSDSEASDFEGFE